MHRLFDCAWSVFVQHLFMLVSFVLQYYCSVTSSIFKIYDSVFAYLCIQQQITVKSMLSMIIQICSLLWQWLPFYRPDSEDTKHCVVQYKAYYVTYYKYETRACSLVIRRLLTWLQFKDKRFNKIKNPWGRSVSTWHIRRREAGSLACSCVNMAGGCVWLYMIYMRGSKCKQYVRQKD